ENAPPQNLSCACQTSTSQSESISSRSFLHFETVSEGSDNDLRHVTFLVFLETVSHVVRQNEEVRTRFGIKFLWLRTKRIRLYVESVVLHRNGYLAGVWVLIGPGISAKYGWINFRHCVFDRLQIGP